MRQIVLDTETTGLYPEEGHRIIEIGCMELVDRKLTGNDFHHYINPNRHIDEGSIAVHGITNEFIQDKAFFADIADDLLSYLKGAELIIHNAPFDLGFINCEYTLLDKKWPGLAKYCSVLDSLLLARKLYPGKKNSLDALCKRHGIDLSTRELHGALLDAGLLTEVYLLMTGGQIALEFGGDSANTSTPWAVDISLFKPVNRSDPLQVIPANEAELAEHKLYLKRLEKASGGQCQWLQSASQSEN